MRRSSNVGLQFFFMKRTYKAQPLEFRKKNNDHALLISANLPCIEKMGSSTKTTTALILSRTREPSY
jgi:hypothetical protein